MGQMWAGKINTESRDDGPNKKIEAITPARAKRWLFSPATDSKHEARPIQHTPLL